MFSFWPILTAMALALWAPFPGYHFLQRTRLQLGRLFLTIAVAASAFCIMAGIDLLGGWGNPLADVDSGDLARTASGHGGRSGLVLLMIRYWPWCLLALGAWCGFHAGRVLLVSFTALRRKS